MTFKIELTTATAQNSVNNLNTAIEDIATKSDRATRHLNAMGESGASIGGLAKNISAIASESTKVQATAKSFESMSKWLSNSASNADKLNTSIGNLNRTIADNLIAYKAYISAMSGSVAILQTLKKDIEETTGIINRNKTAVSGASTAYRNLNTNLRNSVTRFSALSEAKKNINNGDFEKLAETLEKLKPAGGKGANGLKKLSNGMSGADQEAAALRASLNSLGTHMGIFTGRTIVTASVFYAMVSGIKTMITASTAFEKEMLRANAVMGASASDAEQLETKVRSLARTTIFTAGQVAEGLTYLGMAGLSAEEAFYALEPSLNIAKIGMISFQESADIVTNVLRGFKLESEELSNVADDLATAITSSNATIQQLAKSLSYVAPIAAAAGGSVGEVVSMLSAMHDVGIKSSRAGTALRRAYTNLIAPSTKVKSTLSRLGVILTDSSGRMRSLTNIMIDLGKNGADSADMVSLFGVRASAAMISLLNDVTSVNPKLKELQEKLEGNKDAAKNLGEQFEDYLGADALKLVSAIHEKMQQVFDINNDNFRGIISELTDFVNNIDAEAVGKFFTTISNGIKVMAEHAGVIAFLATMTVMTTLFRTLTYGIGSVVSGMQNFFIGIGTKIDLMDDATISAHKYKNQIKALGAAMMFLGGPLVKAVGLMVGVAAGMATLSFGMKTQEEAARSAAIANADYVKSLNDIQKIKDKNGVVVGEVATSTANISSQKVFGQETTTIDAERKKRLKQIEEMKAEIKKSQFEEQSLMSQLSKAKSGSIKFSEQLVPEERKDLEYKKNDFNDYGYGYQDLNRSFNRKPTFKYGTHLIKDSGSTGERFSPYSVVDPNPEPPKQTPFDKESGIAALQKQLDDIRSSRPEHERKLKELKAEYKASVDLDVGISDMESGRKLQDQLDSYAEVPDFAAQIKKSQDELASQIKDIEYLEEIGVYSPDQAMASINNVRSSALLEIQAAYDGKKAELDVLRDKYEKQIGVDQKTGKLPYQGKDHKDRDTYKPLTFDGSDELIEARQELDKLDEEMNGFIKTIKEANKGDLRGFFKDLLKDAKFETAADKLTLFNEKLKATAKTIEAKTEAIKSGKDSLDKYKNSAEQNAIATANNTIAEQARNIKLAEVMDKDNAAIAIMKAKHAELVKQRDILLENVDANEKLRAELDAAKEEKDYVEELKRGQFAPDTLKAEIEYEANSEKLRDYFTEVRGIKADDLDSHQEYLDAKEEMDADFWLSQNEMVDEFFESLSANTSRAITDVITYQSTWEEAGQNIAKAVIGSVVGALVEVGLTEFKNFISRQFFSKSEITQEVANSATKKTLIAGEATAQVTADAATSASGAASATEAQTSIATLIGEGAAMAGSWAAAAANVNAATFGAGAAAGMLGMTAIHALTAGLTTANAAVSGGGAAVAGREHGGIVQANQPYLVGEAGKELFVPNTAGTVVSNKDMKNLESPFDKSLDESEDSGGDKIRIINAIDPAFVEDYLGSDDGERVILNVMRRNKGNY